MITQVVDQGNHDGHYDAANGQGEHPADLGVGVTTTLLYLCSILTNVFTYVVDVALEIPDIAFQTTYGILLMDQEGVAETGVCIPDGSHFGVR